MDDAAFLLWICDRLHFVHGESMNADYMYKLRALAAAMPEGNYTPNVPNPPKLRKPVGFE